MKTMLESVLLTKKIEHQIPILNYKKLLILILLPFITSMTTASMQRKRIRREVFAKAIEPAAQYYKKRGEEGYVGSPPTVCLR